MKSKEKMKTKTIVDVGAVIESSQLGWFHAALLLNTCLVMFIEGYDMQAAAYAALGAPPNIRYIDMPMSIRDSYQYFTQSEVDRLQRAGYNGGFTPLEEAVGLYVKGYLDSPDRYR